MADTNSTDGYVPSAIKFIKYFSGKPEDYENWEETFHATLRRMKLDLVFAENIKKRPEKYDLDEGKQAI